MEKINWGGGKGFQSRLREETSVPERTQSPAAAARKKRRQPSRKKGKATGEDRLGGGGEGGEHI